jgi:hypothetical protein
MIEERDPPPTRRADLWSGMLYLGLPLSGPALTTRLA